MVAASSADSIDLQRFVDAQAADHDRGFRELAALHKFKDGSFDKTTLQLLSNS